jgi:hypothetical protein
MISIGFLSLLFAPSASLCESPGIYCRSDELRTCTSAYVEWEAWFSEYRLSLFGSFVATSTASHTFRIYSARTSSLSNDPSANFVFENDSLGYQGGTWDYSISLLKDWRYYYFTQTNDESYNSELRISVEFSPGAGFSTLTQSNSDLCEASGCRNTAFERRFSCLPPPSPSGSPSLTGTASRPFFASSLTVTSLPAPSISLATQAAPRSVAFSASHVGSSLRFPATPLAQPSAHRSVVDPGRIRPRVADFAAVTPLGNAITRWQAGSTRGERGRNLTELPGRL